MKPKLRLVVIFNDCIHIVLGFRTQNGFWNYSLEFAPPVSFCWYCTMHLLRNAYLVTNFFWTCLFLDYNSIAHYRSTEITFTLHNTCFLSQVCRAKKCGGSTSQWSYIFYTTLPDIKLHAKWIFSSLIFIINFKNSWLNVTMRENLTCELLYVTRLNHVGISI